MHDLHVVIIIRSPKLFWNLTDATYNHQGHIQAGRNSGTANYPTQLLYSILKVKLLLCNSGLCLPAGALVLQILANTCKTVILLQVLELVILW